MISEEAKTSTAIDQSLLALRRLNVGCGFDRREGYLNVDGQAFHEPDLVADIRSLPMLPAGHYEEIVAQDVLEHLPRPDVPVALAEWARLLQPGGRLVLRVPDLVGLLNLFVTRRTVEEHLEFEQCLYGTQAYSGDFHQSGFTALTLTSRLQHAGLELLSLEHRDEWLFDAVAKKGSGSAPLPERFMEPAELQRLRHELDLVQRELDAMRRRKIVRLVDDAPWSRLLRRMSARKGLD